MIKVTCPQVLALSFVLLFAASTDAGSRYKAIGRVIAKDAYIGLPRMSSVTNVQILVIKTDEMSQPKKLPQFLKVRYEDYADQHPLPTDLLQGKSSWLFSLKRERNCDQAVSEGLFNANRGSSVPPKPGTFVLVGSSDQTDIPPIHNTIPCYVLKPGNVQRLTWDKISGGAE